MTIKDLQKMRHDLDWYVIDGLSRARTERYIRQVLDDPNAEIRGFRGSYSVGNIRASSLRTLAMHVIDAQLVKRQTMGTRSI